ncbi:MAG: ABC transporter ATP-binding protein [Desulfobacteraceae bacterium]|nr:MAG: ABC transporter ATP-binding protein [Desulfobacteraceae bacterium]
MINLQRITKIYNAGKINAFTAVQEIDLSINANSVTVLVGPSGSGKTTLLSIIGCMVRPTSGRVHVRERQTSSLPEKFLAQVRRSTFGFVFQDHNLIRGISVLENIMLPAYPTGEAFKALKGRAMALLSRLKIEGKADRQVEVLSGGERQRVAIARALINDPSVLIADEPTAHLDTVLSREFLEIAAALSAEGKTLLIASHDPLVFNADIVSRVVRMRDGRIGGIEEKRN